ncbi:MAG TPA: Na/Pi cotransporter family protein [Bacteroidales bacterium]|nr:Na/Pi cotransporter family protein [Bacteroidales bacterium]HRZ49372.1 Na/Pi cotransporter family protein [Bacteroidales bacterium]
MKETLLILSMAGSLGLFLFGMKLMSEGILKLAGSGLRNVLTNLTSGRLKGVLLGLVSTGILQSSSAITIMTVGFVNAGIISLPASISIILGANIGTTVTGWLVSLLGFQLQMGTLSLVIIAFAIPLNFLGKGAMRNWSEFLIGFALLFIGLQLLRETLPDIQNNPEMLGWFSSIAFEYRFSALIFLGIGTLLTMVFQSSSAIMSLTLVLSAGSLIPFTDAAAMIIGLNIGTTFSANLAALVANHDARTAARTHFLFNLFGAIWVFPLLPFLVQLIDWIMLRAGANSPVTSPSAAPVGLALFHTFFNMSNVLLQVWFIPYLQKAGEFLVFKRKRKHRDYGLTLIHAGMISTAELSIVQARREMKKMFDLSVSTLADSTQLLIEMDHPESERIMRRVKQNEATSDLKEKRINEFLTRLSEGNLSHRANLEIKKMVKLADELETIIDYCLSITNTIDRKNQERIWFTQELRDQLLALLQRDHMLLTLVSEVYAGTLMLDKAKARALALESEINALRAGYRNEQLQISGEKEYSYQAGITFLTLIGQAEKIGDHSINILEELETT